MEILQTIWNALTNENELVMNIISIPMLILELTVTLLVFTQILNISFEHKKGILYVFYSIIFALIPTYFIPTPYNTFINLLAFPVIVYFVLQKNALKAILAEITSYITLLCIGTPLVALLTSLFNVSSTVLVSVPIYKIMYSLILYTLLFLLYKILRKFNIRIKTLDKFNNINNNILIINFIIGIIAIALQCYIEFMYIDVLPNYLIAISLIVLLIYFCISLYSLFRTNTLEETKQLLEAEKIYNQTLNTLHDNLKGINHDFNNIVQAIGGYISSGNLEGLRKYYKDLLGECQTNNNLAILNPELINNPAIYSLLADKYYKSAELNITFNIEVLMDLSNLNIKMYELTRILGVLFDNALEAASQCDNKIVNITFKKDNSHNKKLIIIQNTYMNKDVDINRIFEKGYSSKSENMKSEDHGLGLWEIRKYLKRHPELDLYTTKTDKFFTQQFEIYN